MARALVTICGVQSAFHTQLSRYRSSYSGSGIYIILCSLFGAMFSATCVLHDKHTHFTRSIGKNSARSLVERWLALSHSRRWLTVAWLADKRLIARYFKSICSWRPPKPSMLAAYFMSTSAHHRHSNAYRI